MKSEYNKPKSWTKDVIKNPNNRRSWTLTWLKRKNYKLSKQIDVFMDSETLPDNQHQRLNALRRNLDGCANQALYRKCNETEKNTLIGFPSCKNKLCFICNWKRQKRLRLKYKSWFDLNKYILEISKSETTKYVTEAEWDKGKLSDYNKTAIHEFDLMSMTLTLPHFLESGFNGERYFYKTLAQKFTRLRQECTTWKSLVFGGEYGIETTKTENGLNIHLHSLVLVKKELQNRNRLHLAILGHWNGITINKKSDRKLFSDLEKTAIKKSNRLIDDVFIEKLNTRGATLIELKNIHSYSETGEIIRSDKWTESQMMKAVMETISYHFEPLAFDKKDKTFNLPLMAELGPILHKTKLYARYGCLYGEKSLIMASNENTEKEYSEIKEIVDTETGEIRPDSEFWITNPMYVTHNKEMGFDIEISKSAKLRGIRINRGSTREAVKYMDEIIKRKSLAKQKPL